MTTQSRIDEILAHPYDVDWSIQGFGMLRTYLDDDRIERLHIWNTEDAVEDVSTIHDHPWDFTSRIVYGEMRNQRFALHDNPAAPEFFTAKIRCGEGGGLVSEVTRAHICSEGVELYRAEGTYSMLAPELHESFPSRGAVSVITRSFHADRDIATVCWREGDWVSAEPRPATREEIDRFVNLAQASR